MASSIQHGSYVLDAQGNPLRPFAGDPAVNNGQPWPKLHWTGTALKELGQRFIRTMTRQEQTHLSSALQPSTLPPDDDSVPFTWFSACSGSEMPHLVWNALIGAMDDVSKTDSDLNFLKPVGHCPVKQTSAAEIDPRKRQWIMRISDVPQVVGDMANPAADKCWNWRNGQWEQPASGRLFVSGFVCKTASGLACGAGLGPSCIAEKSGSTGETFEHVTSILQKNHDKIDAALLETVTGLMNGQQHIEVLKELALVGFSAHILWLSSSQLTAPQERERLWFLCFNTRLLGGVSMEELVDRLEWTASRLYGNHTPMDSEQFLLPCDHPMILEQKTNMHNAIERQAIRESTIHCAEAKSNSKVSLSSTKTGTKANGSKWWQKKRLTDSVKGKVYSNWDSVLDDEFPIFKALCMCLQ